MQVNLRQTEIESALKQFIVDQGISLYGKDVSIAFTAGRKESGISAEITIEDADIPGFTDTDNVFVGIPTVLLKSENKETEAAPAEAQQDGVAEEAVVEVPAFEEPVVVADEAPVKTTSLFG